MAKKEAKERQVEAGKQYGEKHSQEVGATFPKLSEKKRAPRARDKVAAFAGVSGRTLEKIEEKVKRCF